MLSDVRGVSQAVMIDSSKVFVSGGGWKCAGRFKKVLKLCDSLFAAGNHDDKITKSGHLLVPLLQELFR